MFKKIFLLSIICCWLPIQAHSTVAENWERHVIGSQTSPIYLYVKDIDGDGDLDVASTTNVHPKLHNSEVAWFRNKLDQGAAWDKFIISSSVPEDNPITNSNGVIIADIDKDGHEDVIVGTGRVTVKIGSVYWFKAPEDPTGVWQRYDIEVDAVNSYFKIYTMDANEDGWEDIIVGGNLGAVLFLNPQNPTQVGATWEKVPLPAETGSSIYLDDINGDSKTDIINSSTSLGNISWIDVSCVGGKVVFDRTIIDDDLYKAFDVNSIDINGDLKKDVIATVFQNLGVYWYEAPASSGDPWIQHLADDTFEGTDIYTGDIDGDAHMDFVVSGLFDEKISWFEYDQSLWTEILIDDAINTPGDISLDDLDDDGDLDVVLAGMGENQMIWYENKIPRPSVCPLEFLLGDDSPHLLAFRTVRDQYLVNIPGGKRLIESYYAHSQKIVGYLKSMRSALNVLPTGLNYHTVLTP